MPPRVGRALLTLIAGITMMALPSGAGTRGDVFELGGRACQLIPTGGTLGLDAPVVPFGTGACGGVRPGALVIAPKGGCTFNFLFRGSDGARYIGTAGHCVLDEGERTWSRGSGPAALDSTRRRIGEFAYATLRSPKDFALIRLDNGVSASARMCYFGGPTAVNADMTFGPAPIHLFGQGLGYGSTVPARTLVANTLEHRDHVFANGPAVFGDSGAGVISADGRALGVLVTGGVHVGGVLDHGLIGITRIQPQIDRARQMLGVTLTLQTASF